MVSKLAAHLRQQWMGALALFLVLSGGVAYAANTIGSGDVIDNSLISADLKDNEVRSVDVRDDSLSNGGLRSNDIAENALKGTDILESSLGKVPSAGSADFAPEASHASTADSATSAATASVADNATSADSALDSNTLDGRDSRDFARIGGLVQGDGSILSGSGFTVSRLSDGEYQVSFPAGSLSNANCPPYVAIEVFTGLFRNPQITGRSCSGLGAGSFTLKVFDADGVAHDTPFLFIAM